MIWAANEKPGNVITTKPDWARSIDDNIGARNTRATLFLYGPGGTGKSALFDYFQYKGTKVVRVKGSGSEMLVGGFDRTLDNAFNYAEHLQANGERVIILFDEAEQYLKEYSTAFKAAETMHPTISFAVNTNEKLSMFMDDPGLNALMSRFQTKILVEQPDRRARANMIYSTLMHYPQIERDDVFLKRIVREVSESVISLRAAKLESDLLDQLNFAALNTDRAKSDAISALKAYLEAEARDYKRNRKKYVTTPKKAKRKLLVFRRGRGRSESEI